MSDADLTALYRRWLLDLWHASPADRADIAREVVTEDFTVRRAGQPEEPRGPIRLVALVEAGSAPFDDVRLEIVIGPLVDGDLVAARWIFRGRYRGGLPGASAPAGTEVAFAGMDLLRARDGRFAEYWTSSDGLDLMAQLGAT
jgi:hypothetical protein